MAKQKTTAKRTIAEKPSVTNSKTQEPAKRGRGRLKVISSSEMLYGLFLDYKKKIKSSPVLVHDFVGKDAYEVERKREKPLTYEGFQNYVEDLEIISTLDHYFMNYEDRYKDFVGVCRRIKREIREDQITGGLVGIYNPSITQRLNGLIEKNETTIKAEQPLFGDDEDNSDD